nr:MAG TPA: hypothetical protein [Caudoviricetes sp.]
MTFTEKCRIVLENQERSGSVFTLLMLLTLPKSQARRVVRRSARYARRNSKR